MMTTSSLAFVFWTATFVILLMVLVRSARRGRRIDAVTEGIAETELQTIGEIAEKSYTSRFGRPPTGLPPMGPPDGGRRRSVSWYPATKASKRTRT